MSVYSKAGHTYHTNSCKANQLFIVYPELQKPYSIKESFRLIYQCQERQDAEETYAEWIKQIDDGYPELVKFSKTVKNWHTEFFNFFDYRYTNGITECLNNLIKDIEKRGRGYSFDVIRAKMLFANNAVKAAKFSFSKSDFNIRNSSYMVGNFSLGISKKCNCGSGVDIFELQKLINNNEI